ncbi:MAG: Lrp/AsnC ligand binding domain-containing protein [Promethearchaeota archaeon]
MKHKKIINLLYFNSKFTKIELANRLSITRQTVAKYLKQIEDLSIINKIRLENPYFYDKRIIFMDIKTNPEEPLIMEYIKSLKQVASINGVIGQNSLIVKIYIKNNKDLENLLDGMDNIISLSRFQHFKIIETLNIYKEGGFIFENDKNTKIFNTIEINPNFIQFTDFPFKFFLQIMPKKLIEIKNIINILAKYPFVIDIYRVTHEYSILAVVRTQTISQYRDFLKQIYSSGKIHDSLSTFVIEEITPSIFQPFHIDL